MTPVTKEEFFAALYADNRDIMPSIVGQWVDGVGYTSEWRTNNCQRALFGKSDDKNYWLVQPPRIA